MYVAESIPLARGWLRQIESPDFDLFTNGKLTPAAYASGFAPTGSTTSPCPTRSPTTSPSTRRGSSAACPAVPARDLGQRALGPLGGSNPATSKPCGLDEVGADGYALTVPGPGRYLIRMRYSPYLRIVAGEGCLQPRATPRRCSPFRRDRPAADRGRGGLHARWTAAPRARLRQARLKRSDSGHSASMPEVLVGPMLRFIGEDEATVWVETDDPARSRSSVRRRKRSRSKTTTTRSSHRRARGRPPHEYEVHLDGEAPGLQRVMSSRIR